MGPSVSLQLIAPCESFATEHPVADERPFSSVPAKMCSEVRGLAIHFPTPFNVANVLLLLSWLTAAPNRTKPTVIPQTQILSVPNGRSFTYRAPSPPTSQSNRHYLPERDGAQCSSLYCQLSVLRQSPREVWLKGTQCPVHGQELHISCDMMKMIWSR